jgi:hypothetical protein
MPRNAPHGRLLARIGHSILDAGLEAWRRDLGCRSHLEAVDALMTADQRLLGAGLSEAGITLSTHVLGGLRGNLALFFPEAIAAELVRHGSGAKKPSGGALTPRELSRFRGLSLGLCAAINDLLAAWAIDAELQERAANVRILARQRPADALAKALARAGVGAVRARVTLESSSGDVLLILAPPLAQSLVEAYGARTQAA